MKNLRKILSSPKSDEGEINPALKKIPEAEQPELSVRCNFLQHGGYPASLQGNSSAFFSVWLVSNNDPYDYGKDG